MVTVAKTEELGNTFKHYSRSIEQAANELFRELNVRRRIYGRWVLDKKITADDARKRGECMEAALHFLMSHPDMEIGFQPSEPEREAGPAAW